jgi:hypothetical protein
MKLLLPALWVCLLAGPVLGADEPTPKKDDHSTASHAKTATEKGIFPKSIPIPGTSASVGFGGYAKVDFIQDFDGIGNRDQFETNTIPVDGTAAADQGGGTTIHARETRFNVDFRAGEKHKFRAFFEGDFFGTSNAFRMRHAYGEFGRVLGGQTWTTFMDISSRPLTVDHEGPDAEVFVRQAMIRYTRPLSDSWTWAIAVEDPQPKFAIPGGFTGTQRAEIPDVPTYFRYGKERGHVQLAAIYRQIRFDGEAGSPDADTSAFGFNGAFKFTTVGKDELLGQLAWGEGISRYIESFNGQSVDAVLSASGLDALEALAAVLGYIHHWGPKSKSGISYAWAELDDDPALGPTTIARTEDARVNFVYTPYPLVDYAVELLWGSRENQDGTDGDAVRLQFAVYYRFN